MTASGSLSEQVYDYVKQRILAGEMYPGDRINEVQLAATLDISRGPVREGLQKLILEGLLKRVPRRGVFVSELDAGQLRELNEVREALELHAVRLIFQRGVAEVEEELRSLLRSSRPGKVAERTYSFELDIHQQLLVLSGNETLAAIGEGINSRLKLQRMLSGASKARAKEAQAEHDAILRALLDNDEPAAIEAVRRHLASAMRSMLDTTKTEAQRDALACDERKGSR